MPNPIRSTPPANPHNPQLRVAVVDGKKTLVVNERTILNKKQVNERIAALENRVNEQLPAAKSAINAQALLERAQANIDRQIAQATEAKAALEAVVKELD